MTRPPSILCPVDFSTCSAEALKTAESFARERGVELHVLYAYRIPASIQPPLLVWMATGMRPLFEVAEEQASRELDEFVSTALANAEPRPTCHIMHGDAVSTILEFASEQGVDLIVLGTHGKTGISRFLMGSVAEAVVRRATCPVLTVREVHSRKDPLRDCKTMRPAPSQRPEETTTVNKARVGIA